MLILPDSLFIDTAILMSWRNSQKDTIVSRSLLKLTLINKINNEGYAELYPQWSKNMHLRQSLFEVTFDSRLREIRFIISCRKKLYSKIYLWKI